MKVKCYRCGKVWVNAKKKDIDSFNSVILGYMSTILVNTSLVCAKCNKELWEAIDKL
jgi:DNA-directed RNA polymerase subunit RPC12/RpoP